MERPNIENYKLGKGFNTHEFVSDLTLYADQVEAEKKELIEGVLHFSEWMDLVCIRNNRHKWTYKRDNHSKKRSTTEMLEIWKTEVDKLVMERPKTEDYKYPEIELKKYIEQILAEKKELIESMEALLILIDSRLSLIDVREIGKGKSHIWNKVVKTAQNLINKQK